MSLLRPAWHATVTNHTRGWSYETYEGEAFDPTEPVRLLDDWSAVWANRNALLWEHLEPTVTVVRLGVRDVKQMPAVDYDDEMSLHLVRPQAIGDPVVWLHSFGNVSDLDGDANWQTAAGLSITFVDPRAILETKTTTKGVFFDVTAMDAVSGIGYIQTPLVTDATSFGGYVNTRLISEISFAEQIDRNVNSLDPVDDAWLTWRLAHRADATPDHPDWSFYGPPPRRYRFYVDSWPVPKLAAGDGMPALFQLALDAGMLTAGDDSREAMPSPMTVIDASAVLSPVPWKKDATSGRGNVEVGGYAETGDDISTKVGDQSTQQKTTSLDYPTLLVNGLDAAGAHRLALHVESNSWRATSLTIDTTKLSDAQVDYLAAGRLFPRQYPYDYAAGMRPLVVVGADPQSNLSGALIIGFPIGAKFRLSAGKLLIDLDMAPWDVIAGTAPANIPGPTYAQINTAFASIDYAHVDPSLTFDDLKLATI